MRRGVTGLGGAALALLALAGCGDRRSFDERYNEAGSEIEERARAIDRNIANELGEDEEPANSAG